VGGSVDSLVGDYLVAGTTQTNRASTSSAARALSTPPIASASFLA
jgi:hypothetical protein